MVMPYFPKGSVKSITEIKFRCPLQIKISIGLRRVWFNYINNKEFFHSMLFRLINSKLPKQNYRDSVSGVWPFKSQFRLFVNYLIHALLSLNFCSGPILHVQWPETNCLFIRHMLKVAFDMTKKIEHDLDGSKMKHINYMWQKRHMASKTVITCGRYWNFQP